MSPRARVGNKTCESARHWCLMMVAALELSGIVANPTVFGLLLVIKENASLLPKAGMEC